MIIQIHTNQGLIQHKNDSVTAFGHNKFGTQIWPFLACLYFQKQLKTKILFKNGIILILKSKNVIFKIFKNSYSENVVPKNKAHLLKQSIFV